MGKRKQNKKKKQKKEDTMNDPNQSTDPTAVPPPKKVSSTWMFFALLFAITTVIFAVYSYYIYGEISNYDYNLSNCALELDRITVEMEEMEKQMNKLELDLKAAGLGTAGELALTDKYIEKYKKLGLANPVRDIITDLVKNKDLIPYDSRSLERALRFQNRQHIYVISPDRVFANFGSGEDVKGWLYLSYKVSDGGKITWKVLNSYCPYFDE